ncbi:MAG: AraC family transcriptional regulator [Turicibacter sp.]
MSIDKFYIFNLISDIYIKEKFGPFIVTIKPDSLCKFDLFHPTNRVHSHNYYELCFVIEGSGEYLHGDQVYPLKKGDIFICNPHVAHEIRLKQDFNSSYVSNLHLIFFIVTIDQVENSNESPLTHYEEKMIHSFIKDHEIVVSHCSHMFSYIDFLITHMENYNVNNYGIYNMIKTMALEGLSLLCSNTDQTKFDTNIYPSDFNQLLIFIESHLNRSITINELAQISFMSHRNVHYLFNKYVNKTPKDYINARKINLAKLYLKMNYKVGDVALLVGINDLGQFSRLFKKHCGISPKAFQNSEII